MRTRRAPEEFSLSFLDVICCGFGAVILLLMITKTVQPQIIEAAVESMEGRIAALQEQIFEIRGETHVLNRDLNAKHEQLSLQEERIAILRSELARLQTLQNKLESSSAATDEEVRELALARQTLTEEMKRLLGLQYQSKNKLIGGIPVDSEYIIFVIDTSGSMFTNAWPRVLREVESVLEIYPRVKGIQVLNDMGKYMFSRYHRRWIPDSPGRRKIILKRLETWNIFSNSSPVEGITEAIRTFYAPDKKISIYVFGDDFTGRSIQGVIRAIDLINRADEQGNRRVRIHGVGFPVYQFAPPNSQNTAHRFATLMREVANRNGGTFVALNDFR